jgi:DNA-binding MarR family transcriptional regulator
MSADMSTVTTPRADRLAPQQPRLERPEKAIGLLFRSLHHSLRQAVDEALRREDLDISFAHFASLAGLHHEPGSTGAHLARRSMVSPQTMNAVLRRLETEGLIERRPHPDSRRADSWFLSDRGANRFNRAQAVAESVFSRMLSALSPGEIERLQSYLGRCIDALGNGPSDRRER